MAYTVTRKTGESVQIGAGVKVTVRDAGHGQTTLRIEADGQPINRIDRQGQVQGLEQNAVKLRTAVIASGKGASHAGG